MHKDDRDEMDSDLTQIYPMPGGNKDDIQTLLRDEHQKRQQILETEQAGSPVNKKESRTLVEAASPLLILIANVSNTLDARDTNQLRTLVREDVDGFFEKTTQLGIDEQTRQDATYILCVAIDEAVLNTPWGQKSDWGVNTLLSSYFRDIEGGADFFDKLRELGDDPVRHHQLLKLMHYILALGYQGRYYHVGSDATEKLAKIRQWLAEKILHAETDDIGALSARWKGVSGLGFGLKDYASGWLLSGFAALLLAGVFTYFLTSLNALTADVNGQLVNLDVATGDIPKPTNIGTIKSFADEEIVRPSNHKLIISSDKLFEPGTTRVTEGFRAELEKLGQELKEKGEYFRITGHSDNTPLGLRTKQIYGSNQGLSQQRADAVAEIMKPYLSQTCRIEAQGKGSNEPIADNKLEDGRAKNRRVEIEIFN